MQRHESVTTSLQGELRHRLQGTTQEAVDRRAHHVPFLAQGLEVDAVKAGKYALQLLWRVECLQPVDLAQQSSNYIIEAIESFN